MQFTTILTFPRGDSDEIDVRVSAKIKLNENGLFELNHFQSSEPLDPSETEEAKGELIDKARSYPEYGENTLV
jgi:hypothetical protein